MGDKTQINFDAPATLRKWPSIKNQRASNALGTYLARPIREGAVFWSD